jgi:hypothetical protein
MSEENDKMVTLSYEFQRDRADKLEVELEELLRLVGMSRREWDADKERLEIKSPEMFIGDRCDSILKSFRMCG